MMYVITASGIKRPTRTTVCEIVAATIAAMVARTAALIGCLAVIAYIIHEH